MGNGAITKQDGVNMLLDIGLYRGDLSGYLFMLRYHQKAGCENILPRLSSQI